jgi:hypothetical protein
MKYPDRHQDPPEPPSPCCADTDPAGNRCSRPGAMTENVLGADRWYCYRHFRAFRNLTFPLAEPEPLPYVSGSGLFEKKADAKNWAREIIALRDANAYRYAYGIECASSVLGLKGK